MIFSQTDGGREYLHRRELDGRTPSSREWSRERPAASPYYRPSRRRTASASRRKLPSLAPSVTAANRRDAWEDDGDSVVSSVTNATFDVTSKAFEAVPVGWEISLERTDAQRRRTQPHPTQTKPNQTTTLHFISRFKVTVLHSVSEQSSVSEVCGWGLWVVVAVHCFAN